MTLITRATYASMDAASGGYAPQVSDGLTAGQDLDTIAPCYIKASDGLVYMSNATAFNEAAKFVGFTARAVKSGQPVTLFGLGAKFEYATGLTPGAILYIGATAGRLNDAATTGDPVGVAIALNARLIMCIRQTGSTSLAAGSLATGSVTFAKALAYVSAERTATGSAETVAHGLAAVPAAVLIVPTDTSPATAGVFTVTEGTHTTTNVVVTVTSGKKYKIFAWA